jgi:hypothetical protein
MELLELRPWGVAASTGRALAATAALLLTVISPLSMPAARAADLPSTVKAVPPVVVSTPWEVEAEGFWERTRFAPERTFGVIFRTSALTGARLPLQPYAQYVTNGERAGVEVTARSPAFDLLGASVRAFATLRWSSETASEQRAPDARGAFPINAGACLPSFGQPTPAAALFTTHCLSFGTSPDRRNSFDLDLDGNNIGGAIGLERTVTTGPVRWTPSLGIAVERTRQTETIEALESGVAPVTERVDASIRLTSTFVGARLGLRTAVPVAPGLEWINRFGADLGASHASIEGASTFSRPAFISGGGFPFAAINQTGRQSGSDDAFTARLSIATGFTWTPLANVSVNLLGTAGWRSREAFAQYPDIQWPAGLPLQEVSPLRVGWASQTSYGVRGGVTVRF